MPPGGTPAPPGSVGCVIPTPAGAASDPANITLHERALGGSDAAIINPPKRAGINSHDIVIIVLVAPVAFYPAAATACGQVAPPDGLYLMKVDY